MRLPSPEGLSELGEGNRMGFSVSAWEHLKNTLSEKLGLPNRATLRDLNELCAKGVFEKVSVTGRGAKYVSSKTNTPYTTDRLGKCAINMPNAPLAGNCGACGTSYKIKGLINGSVWAQIIRRQRD